MKNNDLIYSTSFPEITLEYALSHMQDNWSDAVVAQSRIDGYGNNSSTKEIRDASTSNIDEDFYRLLLEKFSPIVEEYSLINGIDVSGPEGYHLVKYEKGQFFKEHIDATEEFPRKISLVFYLNDEYAGGTITFSKNGSSFKPKSGTLLVFPSKEEFSHSADPVIEGTKYAIVGFWQ